MAETKLDKNLLKSQMKLNAVTGKEIAAAFGWCKSTGIKKINGVIAFTAPEIVGISKLIKLNWALVNQIFFAGEID
jgi:hypothetical protein